MIYNESCNDTLNRMDDASLDLVLADPPYGIDFQSAWRIGAARFDKIANDETPYIEWIELAFKKLKDGED